MSPRKTEVRLDFPCDRLAPGEECYFRLPGKMVMVQGSGTPALVLYRGDRLICDCPEAQRRGGECQHTRALRGGLWVHLQLCPRGYGIKTYSRDWAQERGHRPTMPPTAVPEAPAIIR